jgi:hypothetical protein
MPLHQLNGQHTVIARIRRGRWVYIPPAWRGKTTDRQTIRKRPSKMTRKARNAADRHKPGRGWARNPRHRQEAKAPSAEEWA